MREIRNAIITSTHLGQEGHGILTAQLSLDFGVFCQGFGGYALDGTPPEKTASAQRTPSVACGFFIMRILEVVGVESWEELKGKHVRADCEYSKIHRIGHILKDKWFEPATEMLTLHHL